MNNKTANQSFFFCRKLIKITFLNTCFLTQAYSFKKMLKDANLSLPKKMKPLEDDVKEKYLKATNNLNIS